ncbi:hypothetical protein Tco_1539095 [Tanacetum coccineum]
MPALALFLTDEIHETDDYNEYETMFEKIDVPMNQPQPVFSTQGTHRTTPRAHRTPTLTATSPQGKKWKQVSEESSSSKKSLKITIKQKAKPSSIPPLSDDRERDKIAKATILSLTIHKTTLADEAQENVAKVQDKLAEEEIEKMVKGEEDEESYASEFFDSMFNDDADDLGTRIEPDDTVEEKDNDDHTDHTLVGSHATGSM